MKKSLTDANIYDVINISSLKLEDLVSDYDNLNKFKYLLIIKSKTSECLRLTIYPINKDKITKITISGEKLSNKDVERLINTLRTFQILHTSGLINKDNKLFYECYLNNALLETENLSSEEIEESIKQLKELINDIRIEEITLNKRFKKKY